MHSYLTIGTCVAVILFLIGLIVWYRMSQRKPTAPTHTIRIGKLEVGIGTMLVWYSNPDFVHIINMIVTAAPDTGKARWWWLGGESEARLFLTFKGRELRCAIIGDPVLLPEAPGVSDTFKYNKVIYDLVETGSADLTVLTAKHPVCEETDEYQIYQNGEGNYLLIRRATDESLWTLWPATLHATGYPRIVEST